MIYRKNIYVHGIYGAFKIISLKDNLKLFWTGHANRKSFIKTDVYEFQKQKNFSGHIYFILK